MNDAQKVMLKILIKVDKICRDNNLEYFLDWGTLLGAVRHKGFIPWDDDIDISMPRKDYEIFKSIGQSQLGNEYFLQTPETDENYKYYHVPMKVRDNNSKFIEIVETGDELFNQGIYIDIFPLDYLPVGKINLKIQSIYKFLVERNLILSMKFSEFTLQRKLIYPFVYILMRIITPKMRKKIEKIFIEKNKFSKEYYWSGIDLYLKHIYRACDIFPLKEIEFEGYKFKSPNKSERILVDMYGDYMTLPKKEDRFSHGSKVEIYNK